MIEEFTRLLPQMDMNIAILKFSFRVIKMVGLLDGFLFVRIMDTIHIMSTNSMLHYKRRLLLLLVWLLLLTLVLALPLETRWSEVKAPR